MIMNLDSAMENGDKYSTRLSQVHKAETHDFFSPPSVEDMAKWIVWLSKEAAWSRYSTLSQIAVLTGDELVVSFRFIYTA